MTEVEGALLDFLNNGVEYITRKRFCDVLGITEKSFKEGQSRGRFNFPEHRLGRHIFVKRSEILESLGGDDYADVGRLRKACLREVTPQDEQDRKDAERYRFLKETKQGRDLLMPGYRETWDEIIDHAMVDEMIDEAMEE